MVGSEFAYRQRFRMIVFVQAEAYAFYDLAPRCYSLVLGSPELRNPSERRVRAGSVCRSGPARSGSSINMRMHV